MKQYIRAIIIDDEPGCVANMVYHLDHYCSDIKIVGTGATVKEAMHLFATVAFDVVFLDIELSEETAFEALDENFHAVIVFVTAYEQYALQAFRLDAADYLVKPLSEKDIRTCHTKIRRKLYGFTDEVQQNEQQPAPEKKIILRHGDQVYIARQKDIYCLEARGVYSMIFCHVNNKLVSVLVSKPISRLEQEYDKELFFRVHKSFLVNTGKISEIIKHDTLQVRLANGMLIPVAKRRTAAFLSYMNNNHPGL